MLELNKLRKNVNLNDGKGNIKNKLGGYKSQKCLVKKDNNIINNIININNNNDNIGVAKEIITTINPTTSINNKPSKKNRRHKTNYKIPLTSTNIKSLNQLITSHISHNQKYKN